MTKENDMTAQEFYSGFNLDFLNEEEKQTIYDCTELFAKGKLRQAEGKEWISCEDRLPVIWGDYIVTSGQWVGSCHYDGQFYDYSVSKMRPESRYEIPVTHWQPLPAAPSK